MEKRGKDKKAIMNSTLLGWIIAIAVLVIIILFSVFLQDKLVGLADYIKNIFSR